ncbi:FtsQ-type POTRA domain-containing protein [Streptococcus cristatus]|uniref:Cell division protein DivIB n=1 Tax=Streptococcus cristatus TaxID=45634 RepID=A0AAW5WMZ1_STRCR|nr:FtsQ-type POTRA domain-containing protein [Streptococcus cristatus]MCY7221553.1 FtsQ-type POTRA domain-containing protein [Streptococcus cristatus]
MKKSKEDKQKDAQLSLSEWQVRNKEYLEKKAQEKAKKQAELEKKRAELEQKKEEMKAELENQEPSNEEDIVSEEIDTDSPTSEEETAVQDSESESEVEEQDEAEAQDQEQDEEEEVEQLELPKVPIEKIHWYRALPVLVTSSLVFLASLYFLTPLATMKTIEFTGNKVVSQEELKSSSKIDQRDYTVTVYKNRHHYEKNLKASSPWIENVEMTYQFPLTFKVDVQEYNILGYLQKDSKYYPILTSGEYVKKEVAADALPEERMDVTFSDAGLIKEFVQQLKNVPDSVKKSIRKVDLTPSKVTEDLVTITMSDEHQILVPISHIAKKLPYYEGIHPQLEVPSVVDMEAGIFSYAQGTENEAIHEVSNDGQNTESSAQHAEQSTEHSAQSQAEKPEISENN